MLELQLKPEFKKRKVRNFFKEEIEPQEILLDSLAKKKEEELGISEKKFETPLSKNILRIFFIFIFLIIFLLLGRTFQLQIIEGKNFLQLAQQNKFKVYQIKAERGVIYDKNGNQLTWNRPSFDLILNKKMLPFDESEKEKIIREVSFLINKDLSKLKKEMEQPFPSEVLVVENLDYTTLISLETKINELRGFQIRNNVIREYKKDLALSHLLGYTGKINQEELEIFPDFYNIFDWVGRTGLEKFYEQFLRKNPGKLRVEKDAFGNIISQEIVSLPESGKSLVLWLDSDLQMKMKEELERQAQIVGTDRGVAIAMDPKTGGILGMVSLPDFDNNLFQKGADQSKLNNLLNDKRNPLINRAIAGIYPTGSTIKPIVALAALEEKIISPEKKINDDKGYITIPNPWNPSLPTIKRDWSIHGLTDMRKAIAESCNVYFYSIGGGYENQIGLGSERIKKYLELFNWGEKTGIDLPEETSGFIPDKNWKQEKIGKPWVLGDTYNLSIGQGYLQITPLQVITSFVAIANGGKLLQPQVVQKIIDGQKNTLEEFQPKIIKDNFIDQKNLKIIREGMRWAVTGQNSPQASSLILNSLPVSAAAKTGTAELGGDRYHNWVTVFAPYENPEIVLTIMLENVKGVQAAVLPVAKNILEWYFTK